MRILFLTTYYHPHSSGITACLRRVARGLAQRGHTVTVLTSRHDPELREEEWVEGVRVMRLPVLLRVSKGPVMPTFFAALLPQLGAHDVVHVYLPFFEAAYTALANRGRKPLILTNNADLYLPAGLTNRLAGVVVNMMQRFAARRADWLCSYTWDYACHSYLLSRFLEKTLVIHPPILMKAATPAGAAAFRQRHGLEGPVIGFAGRFSQEKGIDVLLDAFANVMAKMPQARLVFTGEYRNVVGEDYYERLRSRLAQFGASVVLLGYQSEKELTGFFTACDVLALPSINSMESFGLVQAEAMLCGTPVVVSDLPGCRQAVHLTGMGRVVPPGDSAALAAALLEILANPAGFAKPRAEICRIFDYERTLDLHEELYRTNGIANDDRACELPLASQAAARELRVE